MRRVLILQQDFRALGVRVFRRSCMRMERLQARLTRGGFLVSSLRVFANCAAEVYPPAPHIAIELGRFRIVRMNAPSVFAVCPLSLNAHFVHGDLGFQASDRLDAVLQSSCKHVLTPSGEDLLWHYARKRRVLLRLLRY